MIERSLTKLAQQIRLGEITSTKLVEEALEKARANAPLNAFITLDPDGAHSKAAQVDRLVSSGQRTGPLSGVPIVVKDNLNVAGLRTTAGTPGIDYVANASASVVNRLEQAGAIVIGKTNMHELAFGVTSNNQAFGAVRNPTDPTRFPGGSSGGTAAAIAAGIVPVGLGTDTAGSVRVPAALCGVVGFRPTTWRVEQEGAVPSVPTFDVIGSMTRNVPDVAVLNSVITHDSMPEPRGPSGLRLGVARSQLENTSAGVAAAFDAACSRLQERGVRLVEVDFSEIVAACFEIGYTIGFYEMKSRTIEFLEKYEPQTTLEEVVARIASHDVKETYMRSVLGNEAPSKAAYVEAKAKIDGIRRLYLEVFEKHALDAVVWPTVPLEAQPIEGTADNVVLNGQVLPTTPTFICNEVSAAVVGAPGLSLPMGTTPEGLPIGFELDGRPDGDLDLLGIGLGIETVLATKH